MNTGASFMAVDGMDPRADWLLEDRWDDFRTHIDDPWIPFLANRGFVDTLASSSALSAVLQPQFANLNGSEIMVAYAKRAWFLGLRAAPNASTPAAERLIELCQPQPTTQPILQLDDRLAMPAADQLTTGAVAWPADTVVMGIIDDSIGFAHRRVLANSGPFRDGKYPEPRVHCLWHMDGKPVDAATSATVPFGREWLHGDLRTVLCRSLRRGSLDETRAYRETGLVDHGRGDPFHNALAFRVSHGTHVMDLAAGHDPGSPETTKRPIIAVQLPSLTTQRTSGASLTDKLLTAVDYILSRARLLSPDPDKPLPVVINCSYGVFAGPHDGQSLLEQALDQRIRAANGRLRIVLPSGNGSLQRCHAKFPVNAGDTSTVLPWRVLPDDRTPTELQLWLPQDAAITKGDVEVILRTPDGKQAARVKNSAAGAVPILFRNRQVGSLSFTAAAHPLGRGGFWVDLDPTRRLQGALPVSPAGLWEVEVIHPAAINVRALQAWIQRDDNIFGYPRRGRQSYFDDPAYRRFDRDGRSVEDDPAADTSLVQRDGALNGIATGAETIVVGSYRQRENRVSPYSAGARLGSTRSQPDVVVVTDFSRVLPGVLAAGSRSGSQVVLGGTSVAAPQVSRILAALFDPKAGQLPNRDGLRKQAFPLPPGIDARSGAGRVVSTPADLSTERRAKKMTSPTGRPETPPRGPRDGGANASEATESKGWFAQALDKVADWWNRRDPKAGVAF